MRQRLTVRSIDPDGRVTALSMDGRTMLVCAPDPGSDGWALNDSLDVLAAPDLTAPQWRGEAPKPPEEGKR